MASTAFTVGKLFPAHYSCETRYCSKLVHNACMTLCSLAFDMMVVWGMAGVKENQLDSSPESDQSIFSLSTWIGVKWAEALNFLLTFSKAGGLFVSAAWVISDLVLVWAAAPGLSTVILGCITAVASMAVLLYELNVWITLLPKAVERFRKYATPATVARP